MKRAWLLLFLACSSDPEQQQQPAPQPPASCQQPPAGPFEMKTLGTVPDITIDGMRIWDLHEPCAAQSRLLVVRSSALWCGTCLWHTRHSKALKDNPRIVLLDLLIADEDNMPATHEALERFRSTIDTPDRLAIDPKYTFGPALLARSPLPEYVFIDTKTMHILSTMSDPDPESLLNRIDIELADLDKRPRPEVISPTLIDGVFTQNQIDLIREMKLNPVPPPDPTNEYADNPQAAAFGKLLFADRSITPANQVSCETCHDPGIGLGDARAQSLGMAALDRNSPSIALSAFARWQFWDGRADTLWGQALLPIEDAKEMGSTRAFVAQRIKEAYKDQYNAIFAPKYSIDDATRTFVNVGKSLAAFERTFRVKPNKLDEYIDNPAALNETQKISLQAFFKNGCAQCHWGPRLTNDAFHVLRFPTGRQDHQADEGRSAGIAKLATNEFLASSQWSDSPSSGRPLPKDEPSMLGAFKTPTLRGIATLSSPFGHGGTFPALSDVAKHYSTRGLDHADPAAIGTTEQWVPSFDDNAASRIVPFLELLEAATVIP